MQAVIENLEGLLRQGQKSGWGAPERVGAARCAWRLTRGDEALSVTADRHWVCLTHKAPSAQSMNANLYRERLVRCHGWFMCKQSLDEHGNLVLQAELPCKDLRPEEIVLALEAIERYALPRNEERPDGATEAVKIANPAAAREVLSQDAVVRYFEGIEHLGWYLRDKRGSNFWHGVYKGSEREFDVYVTLDPSWVYFQIPMLSTDRPLGRAEAQYAYLLRLNDTIYWAKFGVDREGRTLLLLEIPTARLDYARFRLAVQTLSHYANTCSFEVQIMASLDEDPDMARLLGHSVPQTRPRNGDVNADRQAAQTIATPDIATQMEKVLNEYLNNVAPYPGMAAVVLIDVDEPFTDVVPQRAGE